MSGQGSGLHRSHCPFLLVRGPKAVSDRAHGPCSALRACMGTCPGQPWDPAAARWWHQICADSNGLVLGWTRTPPHAPQTPPHTPRTPLYNPHIPQTPPHTPHTPQTPSHTPQTPSHPIDTPTHPTHSTDTPTHPIDPTHPTETPTHPTDPAGTAASRAQHSWLEARTAP